MWGPVELDPAAAEPVSDILVKANLRELSSNEDALITHFTKAAVAHIENMTGTVLAARTARARADTWADLARLPVAPVRSVTAITYVGDDGADKTVSASAYGLSGDVLGRCVCLQLGESWPSRKASTLITVEMDVGYDALPVGLTQAVLLLVGQWFRNRSDINVGNIVNVLPNGVASLIENHKRYLV